MAPQTLLFKRPPLLFLLVLIHSSTNMVVLSMSKSSTIKARHLVVLVHGLWGNEKELGYLQQAMEKEASVKLPASETLQVYSAKCNVGRTQDGVAAGGKRLADEIQDLVKQTSVLDENSNEEAPTVTLSFVGNSLGGLYARYALVQLFAQQPLPFQPLFFCTTATPHLGVTNHTYVWVPRWMEWAVGKGLRQTGEDLLGLNDLVKEMGTSSAYLDPLRSFRERVAMANAYQTDFQVPLGTAAMLGSGSDDGIDKDAIIHYPVAEDESAILENDPFVVFHCRTKAVNHRDSQSSLSCPSNMVDGLNNLGWTKILVDVRSAMIQLLPGSSRAASVRLPELPTASQLLQAFSSVPFSSLPFGHTVMIANSKSEAYRQLNAKGRPIMDDLAKLLIKYVHQHRQHNDSNARTS